jgi:hypothetical protein
MLRQQAIGVQVIFNALAICACLGIALLINIKIICCQGHVDSIEAFKYAEKTCCVVSYERNSMEPYFE